MRCFARTIQRCAIPLISKTAQRHSGLHPDEIGSTKYYPEETFAIHHPESASMPQDPQPPPVSTTDEQLVADEVTKKKQHDETQRWWPVESGWNSRVRRDTFSPAKPHFQGMHVPELKKVPVPEKPEEISVEGDSFFSAPQLYTVGSVMKDKMLPPAAGFDPALDNIEDMDFQDMKLGREVMEAAEADKQRLEKFGNPLTVEDELDYLLAPQREGAEVKQQRQEFNGYLHWGLLYGANMAIDKENDPKRAHTFINRWLRDLDLFEQWLKHPKVLAHFQKKFNVDFTGRFDKLISIAMALYIRSKVQCFEGDTVGALKSLVGASGVINEGGNMEKDRHRRLLGAILCCRGMIYNELKSYERAEDDLTRSLVYLPKERAATIYQLRAAARESLGRIDEAREDEELAAEIWENAETIYPGMEQPPVKWVI